MTQELVDKFRAYADERKTARENSSDIAGDAIKRLQKIGYLDQEGKVSKTYSQETDNPRKKTKISI